MTAKIYEPRGVPKWRRNQKTTRFYRFITMAAMLPLLFFPTGQAQAQSALDGFDPNANGDVYVIVVQPDGKILLGGHFTALSPNGGAAVTRNHIARLNPDGTLDPFFNPNANGTVDTIALQADGKILASGFFSSIGGQPRNNIARLDAITGAADSFDPNANDHVSSLAVQVDGKILAAGYFTSIGGQPRNYLARLDPTTGLADSFDPNANLPIFSLALQADGKILVGGLFAGANSIGGQTRNRIARLDPTTGLADSFDPNANAYVNAIALQADGKILVSGFFDSIGGQARNHMARLDPTTGLADSFDPDPEANVNAIAVQADGSVLVGGLFRFIGGLPRRGIARLNPTTGLPDSFDPRVDPNQIDNHFVYAIAVQADGKVLAGGDFILLAPNGGAAVTRNRIARLETDGRVDQTLNLSTVGNFVRATAVQSDGRTLIGGNFTQVLGVARNYIARLNTDGTLDTTFNPNADSFVYSIALQADGKVLAGGEFFNIGGQPRNRIARLDAITGLADSFDPNASGTVESIAVQADGKILAGGLFNGPNSIGGQTRNYIARLDATTGLADSFDPNANNPVQSIALQADGKIVVGGTFFNIGGQPRNRIARLDPATGLADSFNPNANAEVYTVAVQADGKILAGGFFNGPNSIGGQTRNRIARLDPTTGLADSFDPNANGYVRSIAVQADGKIFAGGVFNSIGGQPRRYIARLDGMTGLADFFDPDPNDQVISIAVRADGKVLAGGNFGTIGGQTRNLFARLKNDTIAQQNLAVTPTTITWTRGGSAPQLTRVTFEASTDNVNYTGLGTGTAAGSNWVLTGLNLASGQNIYIRARGHYRGGGYNGSDLIAESVRNVFFVPPAITSADNTTFTVGTAGSFLVTTTGIPTGTSMSITESGALPDGVTFTNNNNGSATLAGIPGAGTAGTYPLLITANNGVAPNATQNFTLTILATPTPTPTPTPGANLTTLGNISTRLRVETGDNVLIGGFIVTGTQPKKIIVRAIGPSLPLAGALADPVLELRNSSGALIRSNDNWRDDPTQESEIIATGIPPANDLEAAIVETLSAIGSAYTAIVRGANNGTGIGVVEAYDLDQTVNSKLANISTRGFVQTGDDVLIGGLIVLGQNPLRVIVRAIGPSLPFPGTLADPTLNLHDGNGTLIASNNNWREDPVQESAIIATGIPPPDDLESAMVHNLTPGSYTAIVRGVNNTTGIAVVEAYGLN